MYEVIVCLMLLNYCELFVVTLTLSKLNYYIISILSFEILLLFFLNVNTEIYIYIYNNNNNNKYSREKIQLNFKLEFNLSLILRHVSHLI